MPAKPAKTSKPATPVKPPKHYNWRISEAAHKALARDWTLDNEHQIDVLDRVLAFATVTKKLAGIMGTAGRPNRARRPPRRRHDPI